jgi:hypothetical protein
VFEEEKMAKEKLLEIGHLEIGRGACLVQINITLLLFSCRFGVVVGIL